MSDVDTDAIRRLMERLRSADEHETEQAIGHLLDQADAGVFERAAGEIDRLRARVAELEAAIRACFDESDLMPLAGVEGDRWYRVDRAGCKAAVSGISTLETQELRRLVPRLAEEEQG